MFKTGLIFMSLLVAGCGNMVTRFLTPAELATAAGGETKSPWTKKRKITFNNAGINQLTNHPLVIFLLPTRISYSLCQSAGQDLRFYDADGVTELPYEIERWNSSSTSMVWVKIPQIDANSTSDFIYMRYGNPAASAGETPSAVWTSDFRNVYHMANGNDSTAYANHSTANSNVTFSSTAAFGGKGFFDGALTPYVSVPINGLTTAAATIEAVVELRTAPAGAGDYRFAFSHTSGGGDRIYLAAQNQNTTRDFFGTVGDNVGVASATTSYALNTLTYVAISYNGCNFTHYFNGSQIGTGSCTGHSVLTTARIGNYGATPNSWGWDGYIHEVRVSNVVKSADYITAQNRAITDTYLTFGAEENN